MADNTLTLTLNLILDPMSTPTLNLGLEIKRNSVGFDITASELCEFKRNVLILSLFFILIFIFILVG